MNANKFQELLLQWGACSDAVDWAKGKDWKEVYETCPRGEWLLWLFARTNPDDVVAHTRARTRVAALHENRKQTADIVRDMIPMEKFYLK